MNDYIVRNKYLVTVPKKIFENKDETAKEDFKRKIENILNSTPINEPYKITEYKGFEGVNITPLED